MSFFDLFDDIPIINLRAREDRRAEMRDELRHVNLLDDRRVRFFDAIRPSRKADFSSVGARGCFEGHYKLLAQAASRNRSILILEDDCAFSPQAQHYVSAGEWDIFYGGYVAKNPADPMNSDVHHSHMMGFSARGAKLVSAYLSDMKYQGEHPPIDAAYVWFRREYPEVPTEFAIPPLAIQRSSRSDIAPKPWDRFALGRTMATALRRMLNTNPQTRNADSLRTKQRIRQSEPNVSEGR